MKFVDNTIK